MVEPMLAIRTRRLFTPLQELRDAVVLVQEGKIVEVGRAGNVPVPDGAEVLDAGDRIVIPGMVDIHQHGAVGFRANQGEDAVRAIAAYNVEHGVTTWLPTVNDLNSLPSIVRVQREGTGGADIGGIHMEGPFLTPKRVPGQAIMDRDLKEASVELLTQMIESAEGLIRMMGVSPELPGAHDLIRALWNAGIVVACAHTKGTYEDFMRAVELGLRHVTHTYNVMTGLHHRRPGVVGAALTCDQVTAELIADGFHVAMPAMDILIRCKGPELIAIITDSAALAGLPDGTYEFQGRTIVKKDGVSRMAGSTPDQDNTMAGSEWPLDHNVGNVIHGIGVPMRDALRMATLTPATVVGLNKTKGSIEPGKDADLVFVDERMTVYRTIVRGKTMYEAG